jgi:hypothetical protein
MNLIVPVFRWTKKAIKLSQVHPAQLDIHVRLDIHPALRVSPNKRKILLKTLEQQLVMHSL